MLAVGAGHVLGVTNPLLVFYAQLRGVMTAPVSLEYRILRTATDSEKLTPVQLSPGSGFTAVNLATDKLSTGRFAATWTVPGSPTTGQHSIEWRWKFASSDPWSTSQEQFEVLAAAPAIPVSPYYCLVSDLRDEGLATRMTSDARLMLTIQRASKQIERWTGRTFGAKHMEINRNGNGSNAIQLDTPIIAIETIDLETSPLFPSSIAVEPDFYRVANRHLTGLIAPDDRDNPKIELFSSSEDLAGVRPWSFSRIIFPRGQQNIKLVGVFGYTDPDGSPYGCMPDLLRRACQMMVLRDVAKLKDIDRREDAIRRPRITTESTRDQSYTLLAPKDLGLYTGFTGDPEIDGILAQYVGPPAMGAC